MYRLDRVAVAVALICVSSNFMNGFVSAALHHLGSMLSCAIVCMTVLIWGLSAVLAGLFLVFAFCVLTLPYHLGLLPESLWIMPAPPPPPSSPHLPPLSLSHPSGVPRCMSSSLQNMTGMRVFLCGLPQLVELKIEHCSDLDESCLLDGLLLGREVSCLPFCIAQERVTEGGKDRDREGRGGRE